MHYNYYLELCSLIFMVFIAIAYYSRRKFPIPVFKLFGFCLGTIIVNMTLNITACVLLDTRGVSLFWHEAINELFYFSQIFLSYLLFAYVFYDVGKSLKDSPLNYLTTLPSIIAGIIIFSNSGHHLFFGLSLSDAGYYSIVHGPAFFLMYAVSGLNVLAALIYTIYFRKKLNKKVLIVLITVVLVASAGIVIQFYIPEYILSGLSYTMSMILAIITINDPDEKVDRISKAFNNDAFVSYINDQRFEKQRKHYVLFEVESLGMFNKMYGHIYTNELLASIVRDIYAANRKSYVFKTKSAMFVVLLKNREEQLKMVEEIKKIFSSPINIDGKEVIITIHLFHFENNKVFRNSDSYNDFLNRALSMINFKDTNYVELGNEVLDRFHRDRKIKEILEQCLKSHSGLYMVYQPIFDVKKGVFNHFEALLRLINTDLGYVGPGEFIPIAENAGLANAIDNFVFEETCGFLSRNPQVEILEINVSGAEFFNNPSDRFLNTIKKYNLDPKRICLEITETIAVKYPEKTLEFMEELGQYGVQFAMDDFGSGYSNISRFITLPFSIAKLDKSLLNESNRVSIFFDSAINLFKNLNVPIVIEGVENKEQFEMVKKKEIDYVQGYYFSKPLEEDDLTDFLSKQ